MLSQNVFGWDGACSLALYLPYLRPANADVVVGTQPMVALVGIFTKLGADDAKSATA